MVTAANDVPTADAGDDQSVYVNDTVQLDGVRSSDVDGDALSYGWLFVSFPESSSPELFDQTTPQPYFTAAAAGTYVLQLIVSDGRNDSEPDLVSIHAVPLPSNVAPQPEGSFGKPYEDQFPMDATIEAYDPRRFSLITGLVRNLNGTPIADVVITILNHPEYGSAKTDSEGRFSIPVEGGQSSTVVYTKLGLITAHRQVDVSWNDIAIAETIEMIGQDSAATTLSFDGNPATAFIHSSTPVTDAFGSRRDKSYHWDRYQ